MPRIGQLALETLPRVAIAVDDTEVHSHARDAIALADVLELRIDTFSRRDPRSVAAAAAAATAHGIPLLATVRSATEGGQAQLGDAERLALFATVMPSVDALDVELHASIRDAVIELGHKHGKLVIASFHDFARTPSERELVQCIEDGRAAGADIVKLATTAATLADVDRLLALLRAHRSQQLIVIALGPAGVASRVFFPLFGSLLTWGYLNRPSGPGQMAVAELVDALCRYAPAFAARHGR